MPYHVRIVAALLAFATPAAVAHAINHAGTSVGGISDVPAPTWQTNGHVAAIAVSGTVEYVVGDFTSVRPPGSPAGKAEVPRANAAAIDLTTGQLLPWNPKPNGGVAAIAVTSGRAVLGGTFTTAGGGAATDIAQVDTSAGAQVPGFTARTNGQIAALATDGNTIYLGGRFSKVNGVVQTRLAALDVSTGALVPGFTASADGVVKSLAFAAPGELVVGGSFTELGGFARSSLGAVDPVTGATEAWAPSNRIPRDLAGRDRCHCVRGGRG